MYAFYFIDAVPVIVIESSSAVTRLYQEVKHLRVLIENVFSMYIVPAERFEAQINARRIKVECSRCCLVLQGHVFNQLYQSVTIRIRVGVLTGPICVPSRYIYIIGYALLFLCLTSKFT